MRNIKLYVHCSDKNKGANFVAVLSIFSIKTKQIWIFVRDANAQNTLLQGMVCLPKTSEDASYEMTNQFFATELLVEKTTVISLFDDITSSGD